MADALTKMLGYILLPVYLGLMPQIEYGEFGFLTSAIGGFSLIFSLSLYIPLIKSYCSIKDVNEKKKLVSTTFAGVLIWLFIINLILFALLNWTVEIFEQFFSITESVIGKYYLSIILLNTGVAILYCYSLLMARNKIKEIIGFIIWKFIAATFFGVLFLYLNPFNQDTVFNRLLGLAISELIILLIYIKSFYSEYFNEINFDVKIIKNNLKIAIPIIPSAFIGLMLTVVDRRFITEHHGLIELAKYNLALQILAPMQMVMSAIQVAWAPHLYSIVDKFEAMKLSMKLLIITSIGMILSVIIIITLSYFLIKLNYISSEYNEVISILAWAFPGVVAASLLQINNNLFVKYEKTSIMFLLSLIALLINFTLNFILVPNFSYYGASVAGVVSNIITLIFGIIILNKIKQS